MPDRKDDTQWYSNKDLFEMLNSLKNDLRETQLEMRKYNDLRRTLNDVMESQEKLTKIVECTVSDLTKLKAGKAGRRQAFSDTREMILLGIAVGG
ncbi:MAG: hypothetical protein QMD71_06240 [bacterium]|nr:hypothetical protein [bacterium]